MVRMGAQSCGLMVNTRISGNPETKKTVILSHGYGSDQSVWRFLLPSLLETHRVVTFDLVFCDKSSFGDYADSLISLMDNYCIRNSFFVGHSMSAMIGCMAAVKRPELFRHLILLCGSPRYLNSNNYEGGFELSHIESMLSAMEADFYSWAAGFAPAALANEDADLCREFQDSLLRMRPENAIPLARTIFVSDNRDVLPKVPVPSTIIQTQKDLVVPLSVAEYMKSNLGEGDRSTIIFLPVGGHMPQLTAPKLLLSALYKALKHYEFNA